MLSIGKLATGQASYYLDQAQTRVDRATSVGSGVEDYYVGGTEAPGYWMGAGTQRVGAGGKVDPDALRNILDGRHPSDGQELVPPRVNRVPGFDVTFSAPKSVSALFGLGDERLRRAVRAAHDESVADALGYLERLAARGRRKQDGKVMVEAQGLLAAAFRHRTSRAGDPQLHTHVLVANVVEGVDGKWSALDGRGLYQHGKTAGYLYEAALRRRLTDRLGVRWGEVRNGIADIDGVPVAVLRAFSRRRAEIEAELERRGESTAAAARMATLATRRRKDYGVVPEELAAEWRERAARLGFGRDALRAVLGRPADREPTEWTRAFRRLASSNGLTHRRATFARRDVLQALCEAIPPAAATVHELEEAADGFLSSEDVLRIVAVDGADQVPTIRRRDGRLVYSHYSEARYSTPEYVELERTIIETALTGVGCGVAAIDERAVRLAVMRSLSGEQEAMVRRLLHDGDRVAVVLGQAGTGKTYALRAAREAWEASAVPVVGAAISLRAARELEDGAGIPSTSVAALLHRLRIGGEPLRVGTVVVVDEAGMLPTRELGELLERVVEVDGKLVLTGDHRQLPELEAGGSFRGLVYRLPTILLEENRRQRARWERGALRELRHGDVAAALQAYRKHDRVITAKDGARIRARMVEDWMRAGGAPQAVMIALRRSDVRDLNLRARRALIDVGALQGDELELAGGRFAAGDVVLLRRNDRNLGIANGDRGVVERIERNRLIVSLGGRHIALDRRYLAQATAHGEPVVAHGYAFTGHVAQGLTVRHALVLATDEMYREWAYTALSRGTDDNLLYVVGDEPRVRDEIAPAARRGVDAGLVSALHRSRRQSMALDSGQPVDAPARARLEAIASERDAVAQRLTELATSRSRWWRRDAREEQRQVLIDRLETLREQESKLRRELGRDDAVPLGAPDQRERESSRRFGRSASR